MRRIVAAVGVGVSFLLLQFPSAGAATEKVLYSICSQPYCADGETPDAGVLQVKGELYTTTSYGGANHDWGTLIDVNRKTGVANVLYSFENYFDDAADPEAALIEVNRTLYGTTAQGGSGYDENGAGTLYALSLKKGKLKLLYSFCSQQDCADGSGPKSSLLEAGGLLYGTTVSGGGNDAGCYAYITGCGTVFSFDPATGVEAVVHAFCAACGDGHEPNGNLIEVNGTLYGTTLYGGSGSGCDDMGQGCGAVFSLDPNTGSESVLHFFAGESTDGGAPVAGLVNISGTLYGTTEHGGSISPCSTWDGCGTVFSIDPTSGTEKLVHVFQNDGKDGQNPMSSLIAVNGKLYGTTENGGAAGYGTAFVIELATGREKVLYSFCSQSKCSDGANPYAGLTEINGKLYGTTRNGGTGNKGNGGGTVFWIKP